MLPAIRTTKKKRSWDLTAGLSSQTHRHVAVHLVGTMLLDSSVAGSEEVCDPASRSVRQGANDGLWEQEACALSSMDVRK